MFVNREGGRGWSRLGWVGGGEEALFMDLFYLFGARYQLGHCPVSCSSCNINFIYIYPILFYFILFYLSILPNVFYIFYVNII